MLVKRDLHLSSCLPPPASLAILLSLACCFTLQSSATSIRKTFRLTTSVAVSRAVSLQSGHKFLEQFSRVLFPSDCRSVSCSYLSVLYSENILRQKTTFIVALCFSTQIAQYLNSHIKTNIENDICKKIFIYVSGYFSETGKLFFGPPQFLYFASPFRTFLHFL